MSNSDERITGHADTTAGKRAADKDGPELIELKLYVPEELYRAFHRCLWMRLEETGRSRLDLTKEMLRDFLIKHGC